MLGQAGAWEPTIHREPPGRSILDVRIDLTCLRPGPTSRAVVTCDSTTSIPGSWVFFLRISCDELGEAPAAVASKVSPMNV